MISESTNARRRRAALPAATILTTAGALFLGSAGTATAAEQTASTPAGALTVTLTDDVVECIAFFSKPQSLFYSVQFLL